MMHAVITFICVLLGATVGNVLGSIIKEALDKKRLMRSFNRTLKKICKKSEVEKYDII